MVDARLQALERRLSETERNLEEALALLKLLRQWARPQQGGRGKFHGPKERRRILELVDQTLASGARLEAICEVLSISTRTIQRWRKPHFSEDGRTRPRQPVANQLSEDERRHARALMLAAAHRGLSPRQLVPWLADQGLYVASESTFYRLRRAEARARGNTPPACTAPAPRWLRPITAPNQAWSWDITQLKGPAAGSFLYLYLVMDVFSRRIMGWHVHEKQTAEHASQLIGLTYEENGIASEGLVLCSDNGRPMRGAPLLRTLRRLGIHPSYSRPRVSNDNPLPEALFRTLKSRPDYPRDGFTSAEEVRTWVDRFVRWYNGQHLHSGLQFVSPDDRYFGCDTAILARRRHVYERARGARPERWSRSPRSWEPAALPHLFSRPPRPDSASSHSDGLSTRQSA